MASYPVKVVPWGATERVQDTLELEGPELAWLTSKVLDAINAITQAGVAGAVLQWLQQQYPEAQQGMDALVREWVVKGLWDELSHGTSGNRPPQFFRKYRNEGSGCEEITTAELTVPDYWIDPPADTIGINVGPVELAFAVELSVENVDPHPHRIHKCNLGAEDEDDIFVHRSRLIEYRIGLKVRITGNVTWSADRFLLRDQWICTDCCPLDDIEEEIEYSRADPKKTQRRGRKSASGEQRTV